jgi:hypothetical protein
VSAKSKKESPVNGSHWPGEQRLTAFFFWLLWVIYVCIAGLLIAAMFTNWPAFLHQHPHFK